ncbi:hypothetical protein JCM5353_006343 [Sporobolomyces roseus]
MATLEESWTKIRLQINSNTQAIKRPAVVLSAIESTLSSSSTSIEPPAYFLALLSTLDQLVQDPNSSKLNSEQRQLLEATLYLLSVLSPHLDPNTLRSKLSSTLATITPLYQAFEQQAPALKSLIQISHSSLSAAPQSTLEKDLQGARSFQHVLKNPPPPGIQHPYADESAGWICQKLHDAIRGAKRYGKKEGQGNVEAETGSDESRAIALLTFTKNMGTAWPQSSTSTLLPLLLSTLTLSSPHLTLSALTVLSHLFSASHAAGSMSDDHVKETLEALIKARPKAVESEQGEKLLAGWVEGVGEGLVALARTDSSAALERLSTLFPTILPILTTANTPLLRQSVETACNLMIKHCVRDEEIVEAVSAGGGETLKSVIDQVEKAMTSPRYAALSQPHVLALVKSLFLRLRLRVPTSSSSSTSSDPRDPPAATTLLTKCLILLAKSREDSRFEWKKEADSVLDVVIKVLGPQVILSYLPLNLSPEDAAQSKHARAWLLPLLKPAMTNTRLGHFRESFVPLSAEFFNKAEEARMAEPPRAMEAKVWETLVGQTWSLLPGYCEYPVLTSSFDTEFVSLLANVLYTQPQLRPSISKSLQTLLSTTLALANSTSPPGLMKDQFGLTPQQGQESLAHLQSLAQTILSVAFNVYGKMNGGEGGYVLETMGSWIAILDTSELVSTYDKISSLLLQALEAPLHPKEDPTIPPTHALLDILIAIIPSSKPIEVKFFDLAMGEKVLGCEKDQSVQKKVMLVQGLLSGIGIGLCFLPALSIQSHWFLRHRAFAIGIVTSGSSLGGIAFPIMLNKLFVNPSVGYTDGVRASGYVIAACLVIANLIMAPHPARLIAHKPPLPSLRKIMTPTFFCMTFGALLLNFGLWLPLFFLQLYSQFQGVSRNLSFYTLAIYNAGSFFGRTIPNLLADHLGPQNMQSFCCVAAGIALYCMYFCENAAGIVTFAAVYGALSGGFISLVSPAIISISDDISEIGLRQGVAFIIVAGGAVGGNPICGKLAELGPKDDPFLAPILFAATMALLGGIVTTIGRFLRAKEKGTWKV